MHRTVLWFAAVVLAGVAVFLLTGGSDQPVSMRIGLAMLPVIVGLVLYAIADAIVDDEARRRY